MPATVATEAAAGDRLARRNALVLAAAQALSGANSAVIAATGGIAGAMLAPDQMLATLPVTSYVIGMWMGAIPVGALGKHFGRRTAFQAGALCGAIAGVVGAIAVLEGSFVLFNLGTFFGGLYGAAHQAYRFAAADTASERFKPKAIAWVLTGGLVAAFVGPQLVIFTKDLWPPYMFAASYLAQSAVALVAVLVLTFLCIPRPLSSPAVDGGRSIGEIARQPRFIVAVACGVASFSLMNLVMTSAPLAMIACGHRVTDAALGQQWHIFAMYVPSFFTGALIVRFGAERTIAAGLVLIVTSGIIGIAGIAVAHFWTALVLLGLGWNLGFVGATAMVTRCHRPEERTKVQAFNDFLIFGSMAVGSVASGTLLATFGWIAVNEVIFPVVLAAGGLLGWFALRERARPA